MYKLKKLMAFLCAMTLLFSVLPPETMAIGLIDKTRASSLTVEFVPDEKVAVNTEFKLYKVAEVSQSCDFTLTEEFENYSISLNKLDSSGWRALAQTLAGYTAVDKLTPIAIGKIGSDGRLLYSGLKPALYLVVGDRFYDENYNYSPAPFMICLPSYDEHYEWDYDVTASPKYDRTYSPSGKTVTRRVLKAWRNDDESARPSEVSISLLKDGNVYDTIKLNAENNWRYTWEKLDEKGNWQLVENNVPQGYNVTVEKEGITFLVTNTYGTPEPQPEKTSRTVVKKWENDDEKDRPSEIKVTLLKNGAEYNTVLLNKANSWQYTWTELEKDANYSIKEETADDNYSKSIVLNGTVFTLTNTYIKPNDPHDPIPEKVSRTVKKVWKNVTEDKRPASVEVTLLKNGAEADTVTLNKDNDWQYTWNELEKDAMWEVKEKNTFKSYACETTFSGGIFTITNTYKKPDEPTPEKTSVTAVKKWEDDKTSSRPSSVKISLMKNNVKQDTVTLDSSNNWQYTWTELDKGAVWTVKEDNIPKNYTASVVSNGTVFTVINSYHTPGGGGGGGGGSTTISRTVQKLWLGDDENLRPSSVKVALLRDGKEYKTTILNKDNNWKFTWTGLSRSYTWEVKEYDIDESYIASTSLNGDTFTLTNTYKAPPEDNPPVDNPPDDNPPGDNPPVDNPPGDNPPIDNPPGESVNIPNIPDVPNGNNDIEENIPQDSSSTPIKHGGKLPQTGMLWWPVPVLAILGMVVFVIGWLKQKTDGEENDEIR